jgi:hypothetical protein
MTDETMIRRKPVVVDDNVDWDNIPFHPEAVKYRKVDEHALDGLAASIAEQGILAKMPIAKDPKTGQLWCFDGQNRRDAARKIKHTMSAKDYEWVPFPADVAKYVRALNVHRRHLGKEDRETQLKDKIRTDPGLSNPALARMFGFDPKTIKKYRDEVERELADFIAAFDELPDATQAAFVAERRTKLTDLLTGPSGTK